jgi:hypothetical protein
MSIPGIGGGNKIGGDLMRVMGDMASHNYASMGQDFAKLLQDAGQKGDNDGDDKKSHHHKHHSNPLQELSQLFGGQS